MENSLELTVRLLADEMSNKGLESRWYKLEDYTGYSTITGNDADTVYCIESRLGPSYHEGKSTYAAVQIFDDNYPNLGLVFTFDRDDTTMKFDSGDVIWYPEIDPRFNCLFIPSVESSFNSLDKTGNNHSQLVQIYHTDIAFSDFFIAFFGTIYLMTTFRTTGQLAQIAVDYRKFLMVLIAKIMSPFVKNKGIHLIPATRTPSDIRVPLANPEIDELAYLKSSTALDEGIEIAIEYLEGKRTVEYSGKKF